MYVICNDQPVEIKPVTAERWDDLVELFERPGPRGGFPMPSGCWCMWWRQRTGDPSKNRAAMHEIVCCGGTPGLLAYEDTRPIGWVSVAPRSEFGQLMRSRTYGPTEAQSGVWSIVCFYVDARAKRRGIARALLAAALEHAVRRGANVIEAYPHELGDYMGSPTMFAESGFEPVRAAGKRVVMQRVAPSVKSA